MSYALKNIIICIKKEFTVFLLILLCVCSSAIVVHFAYGLYQNYNIILEEGENDSKELIISINNPEMVTKQSLQECLLSLSDELNEAIEMYMVNPKIEPFCDKEYEWGTMHIRFTIQNQIISPCELFAQNITNNGALTSGSYFTSQQEAHGETVAIVGPSSGNDSCTDAITIHTDDATRWVSIQGKEYKVIGEQKMTGCPMIPFLSLDDNTQMKDSVLIWFENIMTRSQYNELKDAFESRFGSAITVPELDIPETGQRYLYRTILMICAAIALLAAANFSVLYQYLLEQRKKQIAVFRICGCRNSRTIWIFLLECLIVMLPAYWLSVGLFVKLILPRCRQLYPYMEGAYRTEIYLAIFAIYFLISAAVITLLIWRSVSNQSLAALKGGNLNV